MLCLIFFFEVKLLLAYPLSGPLEVQPKLLLCLFSQPSCLSFLVVDIVQNGLLFGL